MSEAQERLETLEAQRRAHDFNTLYSQAAMEMVFAERRRQVRKGRAGEIPHACEAPDANDVMRLGVLGEEFGEICKALIERQGRQHELEEYCHTAAVALACMEGVMRQLGIEVAADGMPTDAEAPYDEVLDAMGGERSMRPVRDDPAGRSIRGHEGVLDEALAIYASRMSTRGELWRRLGVRGQLMNMRVCLDRLWDRYWMVNPEADIDLDDALDLVNYTVFMVRLLREGEPPEAWRYPDRG